MHTDLQQSAFTDVNGAHAANVLPATVPASPFTVDSGRSSRLAIIQPQQLQAGMPIEIPIHNTAMFQQAATRAALPAYRHNIRTAQNPQGLNIAEVPQGPTASLQDFQNNFANYVWPGLAIQGPNPVQIAAALQGVLTPQEQKNILQSLYHTQNTFSGGINIRRLQGGEVLVRCCEQGAKESGTFWSNISDMPLSIANIRNATAVLPDWNQNGNLEFFVVPENCDILVLEGTISSQALRRNNGNYWYLGVGWHFRYNTVRHGPEFSDPGGAFWDMAGANIQGVNDQYLQGGSTQLVITGNYGNIGNGVIGNGLAFLNGGYMPCIAIIETGFDVELL